MEAHKDIARRSYYKHRGEILERIRSRRKKDTRPTRTPRSPEARRASKAVERAVKSGKLVKEPCLFCEDPRVHAHHHDYAQPLAVTWLCPRHHGLAHRGTG